ncbi:MAG: glycosyltransferase [Clostridia bacterium]|nr:glycosyltransferase [Clostridia bacterium]
MPVKLSFIIPVYNVADYLGECIESIHRQLDERCEILLIDDGSTDASGRMCDHFAAKSSLVRAFHQSNAGPSAARNLGMDEALGEYIAFVDADDRIAAGAVPLILRWMEEGGADLCFMEGSKFYPGGETQPMGDDIRREGLHGKTRAEALQYLSTRPKYPGSACTKLFKRDFLNRHGLRFPASRRVAEDLELVLKCIWHAETFDALEVPYYEYRQSRGGSLTREIRPENFNGLKSFITEAVQMLTENGAPRSDDACCMLAMVAFEYTILLWERSLLPKAERNDADAFLRRHRWLTDYSAGGRTQLIGRVCRALGVVLTSHLLRVYRSLQQRRQNA